MQPLVFVGLHDIFPLFILADDEQGQIDGIRGLVGHLPVQRGLTPLTQAGLGLTVGDLRRHLIGGGIDIAAAIIVGHRLGADLRNGGACHGARLITHELHLCAQPYLTEHEFVYIKCHRKAALALHPHKDLSHGGGGVAKSRHGAVDGGEDLLIGEGELILLIGDLRLPQIPLGGVDLLFAGIDILPQGFDLRLDFRLGLGRLFFILIAHGELFNEIIGHHQRQRPESRQLRGIKADDHIAVLFKHQPVADLPILGGGGGGQCFHRPPRQPCGAVGIVIDVDDEIVAGKGEGIPKCFLHNGLFRTQKAIGLRLRPHTLGALVHRVGNVVHLVQRHQYCGRGRRGGAAAAGRCGGRGGLVAFGVLQRLFQRGDLLIILRDLLLKGGDLTLQQVDLRRVAPQHQLCLCVVVFHQHIPLADALALFHGDLVKTALGHVDLLQRARRHIAVQRLAVSPVGGVDVHDGHHHHLFGGLAVGEKEGCAHDGGHGKDNGGNGDDFFLLHRPPPPSLSCPSRM